MTENERLTINGKEVILYREVETNLYRFSKDVVDLLLKAFEEVEQYRSIGTVEEIQNMKDNGSFTGMELAQIAAMQMQLKDYQSIGTIDEFKALKEKSVAKKPILNNPKINEFYIKEAKLCPACHSYINNCSGDYCRDCGQKLDWSE